MKHSISYDAWLGYLDGDLDADEMVRIGRHIEKCLECRSTWEELLSATEALRSAAAEFVAASAVDTDALRSGRQRVLERIRMVDSSLVETLATEELSVRRLRRLQRVVAPACGAQAAYRLIVAAVQRTSATGGAAAWKAFLENLRDLTSALCGRSMARLVWEIGNSLP